MSCRYSVVVGVLTLVFSANCSKAAQRIQSGHQLYAKHGCAVCHGGEGRGDGPAAANLNLRPRDFTDPAAYAQGASLEAIVNSIRNGGDLSQAMPVFSHISDDDARLMAAWIVSLQGSTSAAPQVAGEWPRLRDAWVRESTTLRTVSAAYLTIDNPTEHEFALESVAIERAARVDIHTVVRNRHEAQMRLVRAVRVSPRSTVTLAPGGSHLMLYDVDPPFLKGETITMTLKFSGGRVQTVQAVVRSLGATSFR